MCNENLRVEFSLQTAQYAPVLIVDQKLTSINILWHLDFDNKMLLYRWRTAAVFCDHWCAPLVLHFTFHSMKLWERVCETPAPNNQKGDGLARLQQLEDITLRLIPPVQHPHGFPQSLH